MSFSYAIQALFSLCLYLSVYLSLCLFLSLSASLYLTLYLSIYLTICLSLCLSHTLSLPLSLSLCLSLSLSLSVCLLYSHNLSHSHSDVTCRRGHHYSKNPLSLITWESSREADISDEQVTSQIPLIFPVSFLGFFVSFYFFLLQL